MVEPVDPRDPYIADFRREAAGRTEPQWLRIRREAAIARFAELGFPTIKHEQWKDTNVAPVARTRFAVARPPARTPTSQALAVPTFGAMEGLRLVFVNGRFEPGLSSPPTSVAEFRLANLGGLVADDGHLEHLVGRFAGFEDNPFTALNLAFARDGAFVEVPSGHALAAPIYLLFLSIPGTEPEVAHPRNLIVLGARSRATIVEVYVGGDEGGYFTNAVTEVSVGEEAVLDHLKVVREGERAFHIATTGVHQARGAAATFTTLSFGGALVRSDVRTVFTGEGGELSLNGLFVLRGHEHFDAHTVIDHRTPACTSRELYKGILDGNSRGVFNGMIHIRRGAQKTVTRQTNKNLLLSRDAHADSTPGLEILADDVKANHGSTIGQLDDAAMFYLRSRGIDLETARSLLTYAFGAEIVNLIKVASVRKELDEFILSRLPNSKAVREAL